MNIKNVGTGLVAVVTFGLALFSATNSSASSAVPAPAHSNTFTWGGSGTSRAPGSGWILDSADGAHSVTFQADGNWVVYHGSTAIWSSNTHNIGIGLVFATGEVGSDFGDIYISKSGGTAWDNYVSGYNSYSSMRVVMQNDGNFVEYSGASGGSPVWATNTAGR